MNCLRNARMFALDISAASLSVSVAVPGLLGTYPAILYRSAVLFCRDLHPCDRVHRQYRLLPSSLPEL